MSFQKTEEEIGIMKAGGALLSQALQEAVDAVREGVRIRELNHVAEECIRRGGGTPSFLGYRSKPKDPPFPSAVCISVNDEVVHGSGSRDRVLKNGDLVGLDIGCWYQGLCTDMATTVPVGGFSILEDQKKELLLTTRRAMMAGIGAARTGGDVKGISRAVEATARPARFGIVRTLVGHGVGHHVHEEPRVPNYVSAEFASFKIPERACLAIEPMFTLGTWDVETGPDGWTIRTKDGSWGAHFELTIAVRKTGAEILTPPPHLDF